MVGRGRSGWDATGGAYSATTPEDGGVTVLSKWPILHKEQYVYKADAGFVGADARTGHPYSFDTQENSIAHYRYPDDPREDLDHVLARAGHARPANWRNEVVERQSAPWTVTSWGTSYTYTNLSDHYPLRAYAG
ncbi:hypothetical protein AVL59_26645 [Streptomyces griseochromogenes]|uniref:Endonuclease/exonuclease/phosphatase domain-containing protein n=1 Tax=Streptomyces griseochromogenes TaxID=68214 RepID=A0A1B1B1C9_9ACTN|nr:hypothetical protein AVL59_26645 [Streptomyces griseochromogenes]